MAKKSTNKKNSLKSPSVKKKSKTNKGGLVHFFKTREFKTIFGIFLILFTVLFTVACISYLSTWKEDFPLFHKGFSYAVFNDQITSANVSGKLGGWLAYIFITRWFGLASFLFIPVFILTALRLLEIEIKRFRFYILLLFSYIIFVSILLATIFTQSDVIYGGDFGNMSKSVIVSVIGKIGLILLLVFTALILISITVPAFYFSMIEHIKKIRIPLFNKRHDESQTNEVSNVKPDVESKLVTPAHDDVHIDKHTEENPSQQVTIELTTTKSSETQEHPVVKDEPTTVSDIPFEILTHDPDNETDAEGAQETDDNSSEEQPEYGSIDTPYDPRKDLDSYIFPDINLLKDYGSGTINIDKTELEGNKNKIENTLHNYGISIDRIFATVGPTVTLYEIVPSPGVRISKIKNLEDDIALSLAALGIRIIAPIPGKGTIGIEVPNKNPETVSFKSLVVSQEYQNSNFDLPVALGKTIDNKPYIADLTKMPHLLMAGATGQGKSVGLNTIIASLLYRKHPAELKFVLVDPKKVELPLFAKIERHFLAKLPDAEDAIITDTSQVVRTLKGLTIEMDQRYDLLKDATVRNIKEYNEKFISRRLNPKDGHRFMPYIVLIVDEFADLIMTAGKEIEGPIARIAQLARAVGIHLVIATQRPSVNIITGIIKANFPARMAFRVSAKVDSRTILDSSGADQLIGRGDMLLSNGSRLDRLQCAYIDTTELEEIADFIGNQRGYPSAFELPEVIEEESEGRKEFDPDDRDPMFADAARIIVQNQHGSTSLLQRKLKLGYNRAGRLIDQLEAAGIVGPFEGSKAREVLIRDMDTLEQLLNSFLTNNIQH